MKKNTKLVEYKKLSETEKELYVNATVKHNMILSIRKYIVSNNIGVEELAEKLDVPLEELLVILKGETENLNDYLKLCFVLGVNMTVTK